MNASNAAVSHRVGHDNAAEPEVIAGSQAATPSPLDDGCLEAIKWIALVAMTLDHVNTYALGGGHRWMYHVGRLAMPLFGIVFAANLARPGALEGARVRRVVWRLLIAGSAAQIPFAWLRGGPWPPTVLNVLFLFLVVVVYAHLIERKRRGHRNAAYIILFASGAVVEFWWIGAAVMLTTLAWLRQRTIYSAFAAIAAFALLAILTQSLVPLTAPPAALVVDRMGLVFPRIRFAFYAYYPLHLTVLALIIQTTKI